MLMHHALGVAYFRIVTKKMSFMITQEHCVMDICRTSFIDCSS